MSLEEFLVKSMSVKPPLMHSLISKSILTMMILMMMIMLTMKKRLKVTAFCLTMSENLIILQLAPKTFFFILGWHTLKAGSGAQLAGIVLPVHHGDLLS